MRSRAQGMNWGAIANAHFPSKTPNACRKRHERLMERLSSRNLNRVSLEDLARLYSETRETMWTILADKIGETWQNVETKVVSDFEFHSSSMIDECISASRKVSRPCKWQLDLAAPNKHRAEAILPCQIANLATRAMVLHHLYWHLFS